MRAIKKIGNGGNRLNKAHTKPPATPAEASSRWGHFRDKKQVQQCLLKEQYQLCCYSELRADEQDLGYHIEHLENKSQNPSRTFDYSNLAASALAQPDDLPRRGYQKHETFGGHATDKQQSVDLARFVSCHQADCQRYFAYLCDGRVIPAGTLNVADTDRAQYTIDLLNLNSPYLITLRQKWYGELEEVFEKHK
ncbi:MAG: TIGR02646 family protein, partial [Methylophilaceae bacterium]|nr:TIGR02646 family protein [Methylophilaceae bacterium]